MARPANPSRLSRAPNLAKREAMRRLLEGGAPIAEVAQQLGYANRQSALVMATRWGLNTLRPESYARRAAANSNTDYEATLACVRNAMANT